MTSDAQERKPEAHPALKRPPARSGFELALLAAGLIFLGQFACDIAYTRIKFLCFDQFEAAAFWLYIGSFFWFGGATIQCCLKWRQWSADWILAAMFHPLFWISIYIYLRITEPPVVW